MVPMKLSAGKEWRVSFESVMPSNHLILCCPFLLLLSVFLSTRVSSNQLSLHIRWPKYWSFSFNTSPSNEYSGLISFRVDWFDLLHGQGTLKSLLQHGISEASILQRVLRGLTFIMLGLREYSCRFSEVKRGAVIDGDKIKIRNQQL